jgi:hypothetical protein
MTYDELARAAATLGSTLVPTDMFEAMGDDVLKLEELRCDLDELAAGLR